MFIRVKGAGRYHYLQIVENHREGKRVVQSVICTLGRLDSLVADGTTDALIRSLARFSLQARLVERYQWGDLVVGAFRQIGPDLVFDRLWQEMGMGEVIQGLLDGRRFEFAVERAVYQTVLHRLFESGSDRASQSWKRDIRIPGTDNLELHHLYRAMRWLGEAKDGIEENLFHRQRNLFTELSLAFFDTTSLYFEGHGGESLGEYGLSKDHRPDLRQMVMGAVLTGEGKPVCCELWPGDYADAKALLPVVDRVRSRFGIKRVCWVADRGMISAKTIDGLEERGLEYILGARMRKQAEVRDVVLQHLGPYEEVAKNLKVQEVWVEGRRYVVCLNPDETLKDEADRKAIVDALEDELREGVKQLVGNRGYRRFLRMDKGAAAIDRKKVEAEALYDGKFVLRTNTKLPAAEVALQYKRLLVVEQLFRAVKSILESRPIYHQWDATIKGHVFCSFLALVLMHELKRRMAMRGYHEEWDVVRRDLESLGEVEISDGTDRYLLRTALQGATGKVLQAVGVAAPPTLRPMVNVVPSL